ncbi:amino acid adenylation domain-containing protein [Thioalkalivibrio sp. XN8]|uniref:amino acid adenylation domain-containing protein n=1 Tax=Thioalkalivibrio sp. XN8 TaxID=2712863 RepID=UPI0013EBD03F|nr:amino acid adenylation domain-containing protein [Thioalkalivibrio sp. XN8]NGP53689.1 amino acid adenylation domain-containing protein [Thioalkalivibrio sp. XN8]
MAVRELQDYLHRAAERWPDGVALRDGDDTISFVGLARRAGVIGARLAAAGLAPGDRVAVIAPRSIDTIAGILGVLEVGGVYVPVDADSPAPRVAHVLRAAAPRVVMVSAAAAKLLDGVLAELDTLSAQVMALQEQPLAGDRFQSSLDLGGLESDAPLRRKGRSSYSPAHLLFTSGSTGVPKGVVITHANVISFVDWGVKHFGIRPGERISAHSPLAFDLSTFDLYGALAAGAELHFVPKSANILAPKLREFIADRELTQWFSVPGALNLLARFDVVRPGDFPGLKRMIWCGEALPTPTLIYLMERLPHVQFTNLYGPTEATIASSWYSPTERPADPRAEIPIGQPCEGERLLVLDGEMKECPPEVVGDLYIAGVGLSPGYWQDAEKTAAAFLDWPAPGGGALRIYRTGDLARRGSDGLYYFHGRADTQVKSRGYRIELGEIEAAMHTLAGLRESAIVAVDAADFNGKTICCAFVPDGDEMAEAAVLRRALSALLPSYMLPSRWERLEALPRNQNGKVDRVALRGLFGA